MAESEEVGHISAPNLGEGSAECIPTNELTLGECMDEVRLDEGLVGTRVHDNQASDNQSVDTGEVPRHMQYRKSFKTAVCLIPPEEVWEQIQNIRRTNDKAFVRWMPHINLLFPFISDYKDQFADAADKIQAAMGTIAPFKVTFNKGSFGYFSHKKKAVLWLKPSWNQNEADPDTHVTDGAGSSVDSNSACASHAQHQHHARVLEIQSRLEGAFVQFNELSSRSDDGFQPHLTLGQFRPKDVEKVKVQYQEGWKDIEFEIKEVYIISRSDFDDPFHIRHAIPLGGGQAVTGQ